MGIVIPLAVIKKVEPAPRKGKSLKTPKKENCFHQEELEEQEEPPEEERMVPPSGTHLHQGWSQRDALRDGREAFGIDH